MLKSDLTREQMIAWGEKHIEWVVTSDGDLGVKVGGIVFTLYNGTSLARTGEGGEAQHYRRVDEREFEESCQSPKYLEMYQEIAESDSLDLDADVMARFMEETGDQDSWQKLDNSVKEPAREKQFAKEIQLKMRSRGKQVLTMTWEKFYLAIKLKPEEVNHEQLAEDCKKLGIVASYGEYCVFFVKDMDFSPAQES